MMQEQVVSNKQLQLTRIKKGSKIKSLQDNINYLEQRISGMLTENQEQSSKLRSEVIIYKQKAKQYKEQMMGQKEEFESKINEALQERVEEAKQKFERELEKLQN